MSLTPGPAANCSQLLLLLVPQAMDKKRSKFVQIGTVVKGPTEFFSSRLPKKQRRKTLVEELMANEQARAYSKRKYNEIQAQKQRRHRFGASKKRMKVLKGGSKSKRADG